MRPREQSRGQDHLFRARLDQIIDMGHELPAQRAIAVAISSFGH